MRTLPIIALGWTLLAPVAPTGAQPQPSSNRVLALAPADPLFVLYTKDVPTLLDNPILSVISKEAGGPDLGGLARGWGEVFGGPVMIAVRAAALRPDAMGISFAANVTGDASDLFARLNAWATEAPPGPGGSSSIDVGRDGDLVTVSSARLPLVLTLYLGVRDGVAFGDTWRQNVVDYLKGGDGDGDHFIDSDAFGSLPAAADLRAGRGDLLAWLDLRPLISLARMQMGEESAAMLDAVGLADFESVALTAKWSGKTLNADLSIAVADERNGLAKLLVPVNGKIDPASILPADCLLAWGGAMTSAADFVDQLCDIIEGIDTDIVEEYRAELAEVTREFGFDPQHGFLANLVDEWALGLQIDDDEPRLILTVKLADAGLFRLHLQNLVTGYQLPIATTVYRGAEIVSRGDSERPPLALAVYDGYLIVADSADRVGAVIEARAQGRTLAGRPGIEAVTSRLPSSRSHLGLMNVARFAELALAEEEGREAPQDQMIFPVFQHAAGTDAMIGWALTSRPKMIVANLALNESGTQAAMQVVGKSVAVSLYEARDQAKRTVSMGNMRGIVQACLIHAGEHKGNFPASLAQLVAQGMVTVEMLRSPYDGAGPADASDVDRSSFYLYRAGLNAKELKEPHSTAVLVEREVHRGRGANVAFADGHVEWIEEPQAGRIIAELQTTTR